MAFNLKQANENKKKMPRERDKNVHPVEMFVVGQERERMRNVLRNFASMKHTCTVCVSIS